LTTEGKIELVCAVILNFWLTIIHEVVNQEQISHDTAYEIIHCRLYICKIFAWPVPELLVEQHRHNCLDICNCFFKQYHQGSDAFLSHITVGDKTVHRSVELKHSLSPVKKFRSKSQWCESYADLFGDLQGPALEHYQQRAVTINSAVTVRCCVTS
jgi:hypothetical protein